MTALYMARGQQVCSADEHLALVDAIAARDERRAQRLMHAHLTACEARLALDAVAERPADIAEALRIKPPPERRAMIARRSSPAIRATWRATARGRRTRAGRTARASRCSSC